MCDVLMRDKHFNNSKLPFETNFVVLGDLLNKRPGARKVGEFMGRMLQARINEITLEMKIKSKTPPSPHAVCRFVFDSTAENAESSRPYPLL